MQVVTFRYGQFSHLWIDMMQRMGLDVQVVQCPWGEGANEETLDAILKADTEKKIKAVCVVHNETTTGMGQGRCSCPLPLLDIDLHLFGLPIWSCKVFQSIERFFA